MGKRVQGRRVRFRARFGISDTPPLLPAQTPSAPARSETRPGKKRRWSLRSLASAAEKEERRDRNWYDGVKREDERAVMAH